MPYALIPDGYSLKKVTKLQKEAVNAKRRHDDFVAFLGNPNTPIVLGGFIASYLAILKGEEITSGLLDKGF